MEAICQKKEIDDVVRYRRQNDADTLYQRAETSMSEVVVRLFRLVE